MNLARNGQSFAGPVDIGFPIDAFGRTHDTLFVNMDGNVSFGAPVVDFAASGLTHATGIPMIAPFLADVDTFDPASGLVHYGRTTFLGRKAFCVDWFSREPDASTTGVGYEHRHVDKRNVFQLLLVQAPSGGPGAFDIYFNYDAVTWETGDEDGGVGGLGGSCASAGFSDGSGRPGTFFLIAGSGSCGAFLDTNRSTGLTNATNRGLSEPNGRWVFAVRGGQIPAGGSIRGKVRHSDGMGLASTSVQACRNRDAERRPVSGPCYATSSDENGDYLFSPLPPGHYNLRAIAPGFSHLPGARHGEVVGLDTALVDRDILLRLPKRLPSDVTLSVGNRTIRGGVPVLSWGAATHIGKKNCPNGRGTWAISYPGKGTTGTGLLHEAPPGSGDYKGTLPRQHPHHGDFTMTLTIHCRQPERVVVETFGGYIDPSGVVVDTNGALIPGATVTLFRSDGEDGPFVQVPDQHQIMSPSNRDNPDTTDAAGHFGWDVIAGYYVVRAEAPGCSSPSDPDRAFVETPPLPIPPPVFDLVLVLQCPVSSFATRVRLAPSRDVFAGRVTSRAEMCVAGRGVILRERQRGNDRRVARTTTGPRGAFRFTGIELGSGRFYVGAPKRLYGIPGSQVRCLRGVSKVRRR